MLDSSAMARYVVECKSSFNLPWRGDNADDDEDNEDDTDDDACDELSSAVDIGSRTVTAFTTHCSAFAA